MLEIWVEVFKYQVLPECNINQSFFDFRTKNRVYEFDSNSCFCAADNPTQASWVVRVYEQSEVVWKERGILCTDKGTAR